MSIPFIAKSDKITFLYEGRSHTFESGDGLYDSILSYLKKSDFKSLEKVLKGEVVKPKIDEFLPKGAGLVVNKDGSVFLNGEEVKNSVVNRIKTFIEQGLPYEPLVKFLKNLMDNPSFNSRTQLYAFLEHNDIPITEDGCFFAYKAVRADLYDKHSGKIHNGIGATIKMDRSLIDDNPNNHCSSGLHVGAIGYVNGFGSGNDATLICKINPKDVVSVPNDHNAQKVRVCEYTVVDFYSGVLNRHLYDDNLQAVGSDFDESYDDLKDQYDDWEDDECDDYDDDEDFEDEYDDDVECDEWEIEEIVKSAPVYSAPRSTCNTPKFTSSLPKRDRFGRFVSNRKP